MVLLREMQYLRYVPLNRTSESVRLFLVNLDLTFISHFLLSCRLLFSMLPALLSPSLPLSFSFQIMLVSHSFKNYQLPHISCIWKWGWKTHESHTSYSTAEVGRFRLLSLTCWLSLWQESALPLSLTLWRLLVSVSLPCKVHICSCWLCLN